MEKPPLPSETYRRTKPFKYEGYPALCRYIASDNDGFVYRRFGRLNARVLLSLQNQIETEETLLERLDDRCALDSNKFAVLNSLSWDRDSLNPHPERQRTLERIQALLKIYNEYLVVYGEVRDRESAQDYQVQNLQHWLHNKSNPDKPDSGPILDLEQQFLQSGTDLICISNARKSPLVRFLERWGMIRWLFRKKTRTGQTPDHKTRYYSDRGIQWLGNTTIITLGLIMLFGPMWWLNYVFDDAKRLAIITVFVFLFAVGLSLIGSGEPFQTLAATAAYAAVLMVFMQRQSVDTKQK